MSDVPEAALESAARVRLSFARVGFLATLGARLERVSAGEVVIAMPNSPGLAQQHGYAHGGAIATILDAACGYAALSVMPPGSEVLSVEFKVNFLAPAIGESFRATGRVARAGRTIAVCQGEVVSIGASGEKVIAVMQATMMRVEAPVSGGGG